MATIVKVAGALLPSTADTPLDNRSRVAVPEDILNIENPYLGMLVFCSSDGKTYQITALKEKVIGAITVPNAAVDKYKVFGGSTGTPGDVDNLALPKVSATATTLSAGSDATAEVNETTNAAGEAEWVFNFGIPRGADGTPGDETPGTVTAANVSVADAGDYFVADTVEGVLQEVGATLSGLDELLATAADNAEAL